MNDDQIRDLLDSAAPDQPDLPPSRRSAAVRDRAGAVTRRHRLVLAAAVVAVVGVGVGVPVLTSGGDDPSGTQQVADDPAPSGAQAPPPCPAAPVDVSRGLSVDELPDGAVSARACMASDFAGPDSGGSEAQTLPAGPVVEDVEGFVAAVRDLPAYTLEAECAAMMVVPVPWAVVVSYPDGTTKTLGTTSQVCSTVSVAGVDRSADEIVSLWYAAAGEERTDPSGSMGIGPSSEVPDCPTDQAGIDEILATANSYDGDIADFVPDFGLACYVAGDEDEPAFPNPDGLINPVRLEALGADLASGTTATPQRAGRCTENGPRRVLSLHDEDNRSVTLVDNSCTGEFSGRGLYWLPGEAASNAIQIALDGSDFE